MQEPSFSGGPVLVAQWYDSARDSNITCAPFTLVPPVTRVPVPDREPVPSS